MKFIKTFNAAIIVATLSGAASAVTDYARVTNVTVEYKDVKVGERCTYVNPSNQPNRIGCTPVIQTKVVGYSYKAEYKGQRFYGYSLSKVRPGDQVRVEVSQVITQPPSHY